MPNNNVNFSTINQPVQNLCTPSNIYGGFDQTLFLGCSVSSFTANAGWNEQVGEITVILVQDTCVAPDSKPKVYWDSNLDRQMTTAADPGFIGESVPILGVPVYFRVGDFEYCGIVQSWEKNNSESGFPTYTVKINDGRQILEGSYIIVSDYAGGISQFNVFNAYGFMESFGGNCPFSNINGAYFGTPGGGFGGSGANNNGMSASNISSAFNVLANSVPRISNSFSPYGRIIYKGTTGGNYGVINSDISLGGLPYAEYFVDISELPAVPEYYRINGLNISVLEFISRICEDAGYDYYLEMIPVKSLTLAGSGIAKFFKVRTVSRLVQQNFGAIDSFINSSGGAITTSNGRELRNETMASILVGGNVESVYQAEQNTDPGLWSGAKVCDEEDDMILPFFGQHDNENVIIPCKDGNGKWYFEVDTTLLGLTLVSTVTLPTTITITEGELRGALGGFDTWLDFEMALFETGSSTDIGDALFGAGKPLEKFKKLKDVVDEILTKDTLPATALKPTLLNRFKAVDVAAQEKLVQDMSAIFEFVSSYAKNFGNKFMVRVPYTCAKIDSESGKIVYSEQPQQDGWTDESSVIGLSTSSAAIELFRNDSGKLEAMVRYDVLERVKLGALDVNSYVTDGSSIWVKANVEKEEWVYHDKSSLSTARAVISVPTTLIYSGTMLTGWEYIVREIFGKNQADWNTIKGKITKAEGADLLNYFFPDAPIMISAASFGIKNNVLTYGPWTTVGLPGQVKIEQNTGLVPWEYDGTAAMNVAGQALASEGVTQMLISEMGSIQVAGYPTLPLGAELGAVAGGFFGGGTNLIENRSHSLGNFSNTLPGGSNYNVNYGFFSYGGSWSGLYGPNITGISVSVGQQGLTTDYSLRTFTPKFGRFAKLNADRLKNQGKLRQSLVREQRLKSLGILSNVLKSRVTQRDAAIELADLKGIGGPEGHSTHHIIAAKYYGTSDLNLSVGLKSREDANSDLAASDYDQKYFMGLDSLLVPFNTSNIVGSTVSSNIPREAAPVVFTASGPCQGIGGSVYVEVTSKYLNPWSNPSASGTSGLTASRQSTSGAYGHQQNFANRTLSDNETLSLREEGILQGLSTDMKYLGSYNTMALRGPVILKQFGYDLDGKPVPNAADTENNASGGTFTSSNLTNYFLDGFLRKPHTWPAAPIDLRLDRERGVWVSPPPKQKLYVQLCSCLLSSSTTVNAMVLSGRTVYDANGSAVSNPHVKVGSYWDNNESRLWPSGEKMYVEFDTYKNCYVPVMDDGFRIQQGTGSGVGDLNLDAFGRVLRFGEGFTITQKISDWRDCSDVFEVNHNGRGVTFDTTGACVDDTLLAKRYQKLTFGHNIAAASTSSDLATICSYFSMAQETGSIDSPTITGDVINTATNRVDYLVVGGGLNFRTFVAEGEDNGVNCSYGYLTLSTGTGDGIGPTGIEVVTNVECSGEGASGELIVTYTTLQFDAFGRLTGVL